MIDASPESVIAHAIHYDHNPGSGARRIIRALEQNGYAVVRNAEERKGSLPAIASMYGLPGATDHHVMAGATHMLGGVTPLTGDFKD